MKKNIFAIFALIIILTNREEAMAFELSSAVFQQGSHLPKTYTCDGSNVSPPLFWRDIPTNTQSFVLIMDDPDAPKGTWDHWIVYNLPATTTHLNEAISPLPSGALGGKNSWNKLDYGGPCPPFGEKHRYFFKLYALNTVLPAKAGMTKQEIETAMKGHILASSELVANYQRSS
jgi:Raf kinase inhibitor-like YbhB/YbcL family protein